MIRDDQAGQGQDEMRADTDVMSADSNVKTTTAAQYDDLLPSTAAAYAHLLSPYHRLYAKGGGGPSRFEIGNHRIVTLPRTIFVIFWRFFMTDEEIKHGCSALAINDGIVR